MKYRKKPIIVEAYKTNVETDIKTLEGIMHANIGDYIITGVNGEKYPCKPDIFEKTYEKVNKNKNTKLSPLQALESTKNLILPVLEDDDWRITRCLFEDYLEIIETALKEYNGAKAHIEALNKERIENSIKLKALEIIKTVMPNLTLLGSCKTFKRYKEKSGDVITKEEYNLLKEVLL